MGEKITITLDDETDRWRWVCPNGHRSWEPTNNHFWCAKCARYWDTDPTFDQLLDKVTGEIVPRDEIRLLTPAGPYSSSREGSA